MSPPVRPVEAEQAYARAVLRDTLLTAAEFDAIVDATPRGAPLRVGQDRPNGPPERSHTPDRR